MDTRLSLPLDDNGLPTSVRPDRNRGFLSPDWTLGKIAAPFVEQMNPGPAFIAYPGEGAGFSLTAHTRPATAAHHGSAPGFEL